MQTPKYGFLNDPWLTTGFLFDEIWSSQFLLADGISSSAAFPDGTPSPPSVSWDGSQAFSSLSCGNLSSPVLYYG